ncbi:VOC family protein [Pseudonocardia nigra]|uniref:VOC family protein n=1 Tax=Pseudonocardia nigra TaxID=1921578 RepID=UPI001C5DF820|nr:VOC family protein [Pseudonocardia nigra]
MIDPFEALRAPQPPVAPDPGFARALRARIERALLASEENTMTVTESTRTPSAEGVRLHTVTPYLAVADAEAAVEFYVAAFGAQRRGEPIMMPDGRVGHVEIVLGDSVLMLADEYPEMGLLAPVTRGGPTQSLLVEVDDPDAVVGRAVAAGAVLERPVADSPHGRGGVVLDPAGHRWMVSAAGVRPGEVVYASLWTPESARAERFYGAVLGGTAEGSRLGMSGGHAHPTLMACYAVPDVDAAAAVVRAAGGHASDPSDQHYGRVADCVDDQGLPFALWSGTSGSPGAVAEEVAHLVLHVPDAGRARAFYGTVLGWGFRPGGTVDGWNALAGDTDLRPRTSVWGGRPTAAAVPTFTVADLAAAVLAVRAAGGSASEPEERRFGTTADCADDQGGRFQLVQR